MSSPGNKMKDKPNSQVNIGTGTKSPSPDPNRRRSRSRDKSHSPVAGRRSTSSHSPNRSPARGPNPASPTITIVSNANESRSLVGGGNAPDHRISQSYDVGAPWTSTSQTADTATNTHPSSRPPSNRHVIQVDIHSVSKPPGNSGNSSFTNRGTNVAPSGSTVANTNMVQLSQAEEMTSLNEDLNAELTQELRVSLSGPPIGHLPSVFCDECNSQGNLCTGHRKAPEQAPVSHVFKPVPVSNKGNTITNTNPSWLHYEANEVVHSRPPSPDPVSGPSGVERNSKKAPAQIVKPPLENVAYKQVIFLRFEPPGIDPTVNELVRIRGPAIKLSSLLKAMLDFQKAGSHLSGKQGILQTKRGSRRGLILPLSNSSCTTAILKHIVAYCQHHMDDAPRDPLTLFDEFEMDEYDLENERLREAISYWDWEFINRISCGPISGATWDVAGRSAFYNLIVAAYYMGVDGLVELGHKYLCQQMKGKPQADISHRRGPGPKLRNETETGTPLGQLTFPWFTLLFHPSLDYPLANICTEIIIFG